MGLLKFDWWRWLTIVAFAFLASSMLMCRCTTTKYVPVTEYKDRYVNKTDTFTQKDSVYLHDSVSVYVKGDTVFKDRLRTQYRDRLIYRYKSDTLIVKDSIPYKVEVEKELSSTDKTFIGIGKIFSAILFMGAISAIGWTYWRLKSHKHIS